MNVSKHHPPQATILHIAWVRWWSALAYYAFSLADGMRATGADVRIVAPPGSPLAERAEERGLGAPGWADLGASSPLRWLSAVGRLKDAARRGEFRALFAHTGVGHSAAALALRGGATPLLRTRAEIRIPKGGILQRRLNGRATDRILVSGDFMHEAMRERIGIEPERIVTLPAGIDPTEARAIDRDEARRRLRESAGWPADALVVGMLARYSPVKGHRDLVDAAASLASRAPSIRFYVAGPPGQTGRDRVAAWVEEAGLAERFVVSDRVEEPLTVAAGFDVAVIASRDSEAVCRSALEYMALGLPIVGTSVHAVPETIGEAGLIVPPAEAGSLADAIGRLLADADLRAALGRAAAERVETEFDRLKIARRAIAILEEVEMERRTK